MASNETIQSLASLLQALRGFNEPRREMEMYAKKSLINLNAEKSLAEYKYKLENLEAKTKLLESDKMIAEAQRRVKSEAGYDLESTEKILEGGEDVTIKGSLLTGEDKQKTKISSYGQVYGPAGFKHGMKSKAGKEGPGILMEPSKAKTYITRRALLDLNENVQQYYEYLKEESASLVPGTSQYEQFKTDKQTLQKSLLSIAESGELSNFNNYERKVYNQLVSDLGE